jgi:hypothetical protein
MALGYGALGRRHNGCRHTKMGRRFSAASQFENCLCIEINLIDDLLGNIQAAISRGSPEA